MKKIDIRNLTGMFLIAVPSLKDPSFERAVVLICDHTRDGAFGLVINRVLLNSFIPLHGGLDIEECLVDLPVYYGGPVKQEQGYLLFVPSGGSYPSVTVKKNLALTTAKDVLIDIAAGRGPKKFLFALGFSGWAAGQLEYELMSDSWLIAPAHNRIIFNIPVKERWQAAADLIGVDLNRFVCRQGRV